MTRTWVEERSTRMENKHCAYERNLLPRIMRASVTQDGRLHRSNGALSSYVSRMLAYLTASTVVTWLQEYRHKSGYKHTRQCTCINGDSRGSWWPQLLSYNF